MVEISDSGGGGGGDDIEGDDELERRRTADTDGAKTDATEDSDISGIFGDPAGDADRTTDTDQTADDTGSARDTSGERAVPTGQLSDPVDDGSSSEETTTDPTDDTGSERDTTGERAVPTGQLSDPVDDGGPSDGTTTTDDTGGPDRGDAQPPGAGGETIEDPEPPTPTQGIEESGATPDVERQAAALEQRILDENPGLTAEDISISLVGGGPSGSPQLVAEFTAGAKQRIAARQIEQELAGPVDRSGEILLPTGLLSGEGVDVDLTEQDVVETDEGFTLTDEAISRVEDEFDQGVQLGQGSVDDEAASARLSGAASAASAAPNKLERQLEEQFGTDLERGEHFVIEQTEEGAQVKLTAEGRIKVAGAQETGQTFLDEQIEAFEATTGIDFIPGEGDVVQQTKATLGRAAQVQREGRGLLPSREQAVEAISVGEDQVLAPLSPGLVVGEDTPAGRQSIGGARRLAGVANPAALALGVGRASESVGEFGFNIALSTIPAQASADGQPETPPGVGPASRRTEASLLPEAAEVQREAAERRNIQIQEAKELAGTLATQTAESVRERPFQTAGAAGVEGGVLVGSATVSPVRVSRTTIPLRGGGQTTVRALRVEPPPVIQPFTRRTGATVASAKGVRLAKGTAGVDLEDVDFSRLGARGGAAFEPVGVLETEVFTKAARRAGGDVEARTQAVQAVAEAGDRPRTRRGLELTETEDILREARAVPEAKAAGLARELEDMGATIKGSAAVRAQLPEARTPRDVDILVDDPAEARARLSQRLEGVNAKVEDVFDIAPADEFSGRGDIVKRGVKGRTPLETEGGVGVNPLEEELVRKAGASGFFRGPGAAGTADIDVGPEPRRPGRPDVRAKDVSDTALIAREFLEQEFAKTPVFRPLKRRRLRGQAADVRRFERVFGEDFDLPDDPILPRRREALRGVEMEDLLGADDRAQVVLGDVARPFARRGDADRPGRRIDADDTDEARAVREVDDESRMVRQQDEFDRRSRSPVSERSQSGRSVAGSPSPGVGMVRDPTTPVSSPVRDVMDEDLASRLTSVETERDRPAGGVVSPRGEQPVSGTGAGGRPSGSVGGRPGGGPVVATGDGDGGSFGSPGPGPSPGPSPEPVTTPVTTSPGIGVPSITTPVNSPFNKPSNRRDEAGLRAGFRSEFEKVFESAITRPEDVGKFVEAVTFGDREVPEPTEPEAFVTEPGTDEELAFLERTEQPTGQESSLDLEP